MDDLRPPTGATGHTHGGLARQGETHSRPLVARVELQGTPPPPGDLDNTPLSASSTRPSGPACSPTRMEAIPRPPLHPPLASLNSPLMTVAPTPAPLRRRLLVAALGLGAGGQPAAGSSAGSTTHTPSPLAFRRTLTLRVGPATTSGGGEPLHISPPAILLGVTPSVNTAAANTPTPGVIESPMSAFLGGFDIPSANAVLIQAKYALLLGRDATLSHASSASSSRRASPAITARHGLGTALSASPLPQHGHSPQTPPRDPWSPHPTSSSSAQATLHTVSGRSSAAHSAASSHRSSPASRARHLADATDLQTLQAQRSLFHAARAFFDPPNMSASYYAGGGAAAPGSVAFASTMPKTPQLNPRTRVLLDKIKAASGSHGKRGQTPSPDGAALTAALTSCPYTIKVPSPMHPYDSPSEVGSRRLFTMPRSKVDASAAASSSSTTAAVRPEWLTAYEELFGLFRQDVAQFVEYLREMVRVAKIPEATAAPSQPTSPCKSPTTAASTEETTPTAAAGSPIITARPPSGRSPLAPPSLSTNPVLTSSGDWCSAQHAAILQQLFSPFSSSLLLPEMRHLIQVCEFAGQFLNRMRPNAMRPLVSRRKASANPAPAGVGAPTTAAATAPDSSPAVGEKEDAYTSSLPGDTGARMFPPFTDAELSDWRGSLELELAICTWTDEEWTAGVTTYDGAVCLVSNRMLDISEKLQSIYCAIDDILANGVVPNNTNAATNQRASPGSGRTSQNPSARASPSRTGGSGVAVAPLPSSASSSPSSHATLHGDDSTALSLLIDDLIFIQADFSALFHCFALLDAHQKREKGGGVGGGGRGEGEGQVQQPASSSSESRIAEQPDDATSTQVAHRIAALSISPPIEIHHPPAATAVDVAPSSHLSSRPSSSASHLLSAGSSSSSGHGRVSTSPSPSSHSLPVHLRGQGTPAEDDHGDESPKGAVPSGVSDDGEEVDAVPVFHSEEVRAASRDSSPRSSQISTAANAAHARAQSAQECGSANRSSATAPDDGVDGPTGTWDGVSDPAYSATSQQRVRSIASIASSCAHQSTLCFSSSSPSLRAQELHRQPCVFVTSATAAALGTATSPSQRAEEEKLVSALPSVHRHPTSTTATTTPMTIVAKQKSSASGFFARFCSVCVLAPPAVSSPQQQPIPLLSRPDAASPPAQSLPLAGVTASSSGSFRTHPSSSRPPPLSMVDSKSPHPRVRAQELCDLSPLRDGGERYTARSQQRQFGCAADTRRT